MENEKIKNLCITLMHSDSEQDVIDILRKYNLWDKDEFWRPYGDQLKNFSPAGAQANSAEAALVEKITNSRDARLVNECYERKIEPESLEAPQSLRDAVATFYETNKNTDDAGDIREWKPSKRTEIARGITLAVTEKTRDMFPCYTISDNGEGQTPHYMTKTILSLSEGIKEKIKFVHGRLNMGGTAVLKYCGKNNIQLVVSKKNPKLLNYLKERKTNDHCWGVTVIRRNFPKKDERGNSFYEYLAPLNTDEKPYKGDVLFFDRETMPIFPFENTPYKRESKWGTLIKLYEYKSRQKQFMFRKGGMQEILDLLLPDIALPIRLHECRKFKGVKERSYELTLNGIGVRLSDNSRKSIDDQQRNIEVDFPVGGSINLNGNTIIYRIYAFKEGKEASYKISAKYGILFTLNGQTQGIEHDRFFERKNVRMNAIKSSLLVEVDCSSIDDYTREEIFHNSRDRLNDNELTKELLSILEVEIRENQALKKLREKRIREKRIEKLSDSKPMKEVLKSVLEFSPNYAKMFLEGTLISSPFYMKEVEAEEKEYIGKRFPTFFRIKKNKEGKIFHKVCHLNSRCRIYFETDADNDYFDPKRINPGSFEVKVYVNDKPLVYNNFTKNLYNGTFTLNLKHPDEAIIGQKIRFEAIICDVNRLANPFINRFEIDIIEEIEKTDSKNGSRRKNRGDKEGKDREDTKGIGYPPEPIEIAERPKDGQLAWEKFSNSVDSYTALLVEDIGTGEIDNIKANDYQWYINMDNHYLNIALKENINDSETTIVQFKNGMMAIGLSILFSELNENKKNVAEEEISFEKKVEYFTRSISPMLLPIIKGLGAIEND